MDDVTKKQPRRLQTTSVEKLVTVEVQKEFNLFEGTTETQIFVKMYLAARTSGLLAAMSDRDWKTLCVLATYMDEEGFCYPSQTELARALGVSRQMANERIQNLAQFTFKGQPVVLIEKSNRDRHGRWNRNGYRVLPICNLGIFDGREDAPEAKKFPNRVEKNRTKNKETVSSQLDTVDAAVSSHTVTVQLDTNKNQLINQKQIIVDDTAAIFSRTLQARGIAPRVAAKLAREYSAEKIQEKVELLDFLVETSSPHVARNPAGFLRKAIEEDYPLPPGFKSKTERAREALRQAEQNTARQAELRLAEAEAAARQYQNDPLQRAMQEYGTGAEMAEQWREAQEIMAQQSPPSIFQSYLKPTALLRVQDGVAVIGTGSEAAAGWMAGRWTPIIQRALREVFGENLALEFVVVHGKQRLDGEG